MRNPRNVRLVLWCIYTLSINFLALFFPYGFFPQPNAEPLKTFTMSLTRHAETQAIPVTLPDDWHHKAYQESERWYWADVFPERMLDASAGHIWAVYLPSVTHNAAVYINGIWVGQGGHFEPPVSRNHNTPLLFPFAAALLHTDKPNKVEIRVKASSPTQGLLDQIYIAPIHDLEPAYKFKHFVRVDFIRWVTFAMYCMGLIVFAFWLARRQDVIYGVFSALLLIWATHNLNLFVSDIPVSARTWEAMTMSTLGWTVVVMVFFNHRYVGEGSKKVELAVAIFGVLGLGIFFLPNIGDILSVGYQLWDAFLIVFGVYAITHLFRAYWHTQHHDVYLMLLVGTPILAFGLHDILTVNNLRDRREGLIIQYSVIPAIALFSWFLVRRFVQSLNQAERLATTLERRVQDREQELRTQFQKLKSLEQSQLLAQERERIMRDMHDGIGGQLLSLYQQLHAQQGTIFERLRECVQNSIDDLRMVIDSLDPVLNDIPTLLGMMRARLSSQLQIANITLEWRVSDLPEFPDLSPKRSLHIMRIVQEAVANAIKHSGTDHLIIATAMKGDKDKHLYIDIIDLGCGIPESASTSSGRGIQNMQHRAEQIGANLLFLPVQKSGSDSQGLRVRLQLMWQS